MNEFLLKHLNEERIKTLEPLGKRFVNFFNKFNEIDSVPVSQWKAFHFLSYIDRKYRDLYCKNFNYSLNKTPSKTKEIYFVNKMIASLCTSDNFFIKEYIDWVFERKLSQKKTLRSMNFFSTPEIIREFILYKAKSEIITRSTVLSDKCKSIVNEFGLTYIKTYGDLSFLKMAVVNPEHEHFMLFEKLKETGFNISILDSLK